MAFPAADSSTGTAWIRRRPPWCRAPDGAFYVGELTSYPYNAGAADVWRVVPGQKPTVYASGLSKIIDIAFDPQGRLLVLETGGRVAPTALVRINRDGTQTVLLTRPS